MDNMVEKRAETDGGLEPVGPFRKGPTFITSGHRPIHPIRKERIDRAVSRMLSEGVEEDIDLNICVRSIDGFYSFPDGEKFSNIPKVELADVIDFDPTREVFIIRGETKPDISSEIIWFAFKALEGYNYLCVMSIGGEWPMDIPRKPDERIDLGLNIAKRWNENRSFALNGYRYIKSNDIEDIVDEIIDSSVQKSQ